MGWHGTYMHNRQCSRNNIKKKWVYHHGDVIMGTIASQITSLTELFIQTQIIENIKAPRHWPLCGTGPPHKWSVTRKMLPFDDVIMFECHMSSQVIAPWILHWIFPCKGPGMRKSFPLVMTSPWYLVITATECDLLQSWTYLSDLLENVFYSFSDLEYASSDQTDWFKMIDKISQNVEAFRILIGISRKRYQLISHTPVGVNHCLVVYCNEWWYDISGTNSTVWYCI